jgi:hypothetical protein
MGEAAMMTLSTAAIPGLRIFCIAMPFRDSWLMDGHINNVNVLLEFVDGFVDHLAVVAVGFEIGLVLVRALPEVGGAGQVGEPSGDRDIAPGPVAI